MTVEEFIAQADRVISILGPKPKTLHEQQRAAALARLGGSTMPTDPTKLPGWHEEAAIKNGWKEARRPGGDEV